MLKLFSRGDFEKAVEEHKAERHARGFTSWGQFIAMLFCHLGRAHFLREICGGLACCEGRLKHLGVPVAPKKSTLAYANENRPWELSLLPADDQRGSLVVIRVTSAGVEPHILRLV